MIGRSGNPTLKENTFQRTGDSHSGGVMTIDGTVNKTFIALAILLGGAFAAWSMYEGGNASVMGLAIGGAIAGFVLALIISFVPRSAPYLVPIYAAVEGLFLGAISAHFNAQTNGIAMQAALLTMGVFLAMLLAYKTGLIKATPTFKKIVIAATLGIMVMYLFSFVLSFFGVGMSFLHDSSMLSIGISLVVVGIAALNLVLDFDFIEQGSQQGAPKYMEWFGAFGLLVTLVWLYVEMLRLLSKLANRD
ncbi:Bax inhibitor-1/YccA family protein [Paenibacillus chungangensis]|uniref:Bax inhibitor-1/YccA family protein n=1 Tax=Paenibacillus chungangensis TaxID=696535 RepID=A0ABW3HP10_9BACL